MRSELQRRGIDRELAADTLSDLPDNSGKIDAFLARRLHDPSDREAVRKVSAALFRRGFSWEEMDRMPFWISAMRWGSAPI